MVIISSIAAFYSSVIILVAIMFASSLISSIRMFTYRVGKVPFLVIDTIWSWLRLKYSEEDADERYKAHSLRTVKIFYPIAIISFLVWAITEIVLLITK